MKRSLVVSVLILAALLVSVNSSNGGTFYKKLRGHSCVWFQDKNLGAGYKDVQECGAATRRDPDCTGTEIMWSIYSSRDELWGCRCCGKKPKGKTDEEAYKKNVNWDIYDYTELFVPPHMIGPCAANEVELEIRIATDSFPLETKWTLDSECAQTTQRASQEYDKPYKSYSHKECVTPARYTFNISDWFGDGMCCEYGKGGSYIVNYDGRTVASGSDFEYFEATTFGSQCQETSLSMAGWSCAKNQDKYLGVFENPQECGAMALTDPSCTGSEIMWAPKNRQWGCLCCAPKTDSWNYKENENWSLYQFVDKPLE